MIATSLNAQYGDQAIIGARAALQSAAALRDADAIDLWSEVCAILATDQPLTIISG